MSGGRSTDWSVDELGNQFLGLGDLVAVGREVAGLQRCLRAVEGVFRLLRQLSPRRRMAATRVGVGVGDAPAVGVGVGVPASGVGDAAGVAPPVGKEDSASPKTTSRLRSSVGSMAMRLPLTTTTRFNSGSWLVSA